MPIAHASSLLAASLRRAEARMLTGSMGLASVGAITTLLLGSLPPGSVPLPGSNLAQSDSAHACRHACHVSGHLPAALVTEVCRASRTHQADPDRSRGCVFAIYPRYCIGGKVQ